MRRYVQLQLLSIQASPRTTRTSLGRALVDKLPTRRRFRGFPIRSDICWRVPSALARDRRPTQRPSGSIAETTRPVSHRKASESTRPTQHIPTRTPAANILEPDDLALKVADRRRRSPAPIGPPVHRCTTTSPKQESEQPFPLQKPPKRRTSTRKFLLFLQLLQWVPAKKEVNGR